MVRLLMHLLKWVYQPTRRTKSWRVSIRSARLEIGFIVQISPSLRRHQKLRWEDYVVAARKLAADETGLSLKHFPDVLPFTLEQVLDDDFWPE
jgi:hypothetical protein